MIAKPKDVIAVYDDGGKTVDRYTCVLTWKETGNRRSMIAMGSDVTSPLGFSQFTSGIVGKHLGKRLRWKDVPEHIRKHIAWRLAPEEG